MVEAGTELTLCLALLSPHPALYTQLYTLKPYPSTLSGGPGWNWILPLPWAKAESLAQLCAEKELKSCGMNGEKGQGGS